MVFCDFGNKIEVIEQRSKIIFKVKEKRPSNGCGNCQDSIHGEVNNETASFYVNNDICKQHVSFSGTGETFSVTFQ